MKTLTIRMATNDTAEVLLYDVIGEDLFGGLSALTFREQVKGVKAKTLNLRINSPGGSVTEGAAMLAALDDWARGQGRTIEVDIDGLAASAASVVAMAGRKVRMASNALMMIHKPFAGVLGTAEDMRHTADVLDKAEGQILDAYLRRAKLSRQQLTEAMAAETWYTGQEAVDAGLADEVAGAVNVAAFAGQAPLLAKLGYKRTPPLPVDAAAMAETARRRAIAARW